MTLHELWSLATVKVGDYTTWPAPYGAMCVTLEDAEFLHSLVRVTKPERVLELGTGYGISARFIAEALANNGHDGILVTVEPDVVLAANAGKLLRMNGVLTVQPEDVPAFEPNIVFVDSGYDRRPADIREWLTNGYQGLVVVHDANRQYPELDLGVGVFLPGSDGLWIGRAKP